MRGYGVSIESLNYDMWKVLVVLMPPESEQANIVLAIDVTTAKLDHAISTAEREIALLREYRTRLIADVVTGKLDVREAAARLPEEVEDAEPFDATDVISVEELGDVGDLESAAEEVEA